MFDIFASKMTQTLNLFSKSILDQFIGLHTNRQLCVCVNESVVKQQEQQNVTVSHSLGHVVTVRHLILQT